MFSRRPIERLNRGRIASALAGGDPSGVTPDVLAPFLGQSTAVTTSVDRYRTAAGFTQSALDTWLGDDGHWYQITVTWNNSFKAVTAVRRIDQSTWTEYTGTFAPQKEDNDEHYNIVVFVDGSQRVWIMGGTHAEPIRWLMLAKGAGFVPTSSNAQFNRSWLGGDVNIPLETGATNENDVPYCMPVKFTQGSGEGDVLLFYRKGSSGEGQLMLKYLDHDKGTNGTWKGLAVPMVDATADGESAYPHHIALSPVMVSGQYKVAVVWNWRRTGVATTAHDICVVYGLITPATAGSDATATWWKDPACTVSQTLPIRVTTNTPTLVATVAEDHGMWDLGDATWDSTGLLPLITKSMCYTPADVHIGTDTPHNVEFHAWEWNGSAFVRSAITALNDTTTHYDSIAAGTIRQTPGAVIYNGLRHFYVNIEDTDGNVGMTRITTANYLDFEYTQVSAPSGVGLPDCSTCFDYTTLARSGNRYAGFVAQRNLNTPVEVNRYVVFEDLSTVQSPAPRLHRIGGALTGGAHAYAFQADSQVTSSGGSISAVRSVVLGGKYHLSQGTGSAQAALTSGPGGVPLMSFNGTSSYYPISGSINPAAPDTGANQLLFWFVLRKISHIVGSVLVCGQSVSTMGVGYHSTSPQVGQRNSTVSNLVSFNTTDYVVLFVKFTGSTADYCKLGTAAAVTGANAGTSDPSRLTLGAVYNGTTPSAWGNFALYATGLVIGGEFVDLNATANAWKAALESRYSGLTITV